MTTLAIAHFYHPFAHIRNTGASPESRQLQAQLEKLFRHFRGRGERLRAIGELDEAYSQGRADNWDEYGAQSVSKETYVTAFRFLEALPSAVPSPEISLDPDGEINFEWNNAGKIFSASIGETGVLSYAGVFGTNLTAHGTEIFDDTIPEAIIQNIKRLGYQF